MSCLAATIFFLRDYQFTHSLGWSFYEFDKGQKTELLVHTWVSNETEAIKFIVSKNPNLDILKTLKVIDKGMCLEGVIPYTYYTLKLPNIKGSK